MTKLKFIFGITTLLLSLNACLNKGNNDTSVYSIRSVAFRAVMKNKDRKVLARYEDLYQKLADIEHAMSEEQKIQYKTETEKIYQHYCQ